MGCCGFKERGIITLIGIWAIIQCTAYLTLSILGKMANNCEISMSGDRLQYLMYLIYFRGEKCDPIDLKYLGLEVPEQVQIIAPNTTAITERMKTFVLIYFILSIVWMVITFILIVGTFISRLNKYVYYVFYLSWIIACLSTLILDGVTTAYFIKDAFNTQTVDSLLDVLEIENKDDILSILTDLPTFVYSIPSIILGCIAARGVLFWIINAITICVVFFVGSSYAKKVLNKKNKKPIVKQPDFGYQPTDHHSTNGINRPASSQMRYVDQAQSQYQYDNPNYNEGSYDYSLARLSRQESETNERSHNRMPNDRGYNDRQQNERMHNDRMTNDRIQNGYDRQQNDRRFGENNNRHNSTSNRPNEQNLRRSTSHSSADRDNGLNTPPIRSYGHTNKEPFSSVIREEKRNSIEPNQKPERPHIMKQPVDNVIKEEDHARNNAEPPEELRSQLPWSYTQGIAAPKRQFVVVKEKEELPPVPIPDYTLHYPKLLRQTVQNESI